MAWYYHLKGENHGPIPEPDLHNLAKANAIDPDTLVWTEGMAQWEPYHTSQAATSAAAVVAASTPTATPAPSASSATTTLKPMQTCAECGKLFPEEDMLKYENSWVCAACKPVFFQRVKEGALPVGTFEYASILKRFVAIFVDGIIIDIVVFAPIIMFAGFSGLAHKDTSPGVTAIIIFFQYVLPALYEIIFIAKFGATPGKMLMKIKVVTADGVPMTYGRSTGRYFAKMLSALILGIGYFMAIWDDQKRALHDRICKTRVVVNDPS